MSDDSTVNPKIGALSYDATEGAGQNQPVPSVALPPAHLTARVLADTLRTLYTNMIHGHYVRHTDIEATAQLAEEHAADLEAAHVEGPAEDQTEVEKNPVYYADGTPVPKVEAQSAPAVEPPTLRYTDGVNETVPAADFAPPGTIDVPAAHFITRPVEDENTPQEA